MLSSVGEGAAVVARSAVWCSVDGCRSTRTATTRDATSTTAADNRRHRTLVFRQKCHSREITGRRRPAGDESCEWRSRQQRCQCMRSRTIISTARRGFSGVLKKLVLSSKRSICRPNFRRVVHCLAQNIFKFTKTTKDSKRLYRLLKHTVGIKPTRITWIHCSQNKKKTWSTLPDMEEVSFAVLDLRPSAMRKNQSTSFVRILPRRSKYRLFRFKIQIIPLK